MLRIESPPKAKKLSRTPTRSTPKTCPQMPANASSVSFRGATYASASSGREPSGAGNAFRSTLPFGNSGRRSNTWTADGTMYSGSRPRR